MPRMTKIFIAGGAVLFLSCTVTAERLPPSGSASWAQGALSVSATLAKPRTGANNLVLKITDNSGKPVDDAQVALSVAMSDMDMGTAHPTVANNGGGIYSAHLQFSMAGAWRVVAKVASPIGTVTKTFDFVAQAEEAGIGSSAMTGRLGPWGMQREASGTSWVPDSSPMFMKVLPKSGRYDLGLMGSWSFDFSDAGGPRGDSRFYSNSMLMLMGRRDTGGGTVGFSLMASLDPVFNGEYGYPNLFQTGETAYGNKLTDYQHPHDLLAEVAVSYSHPIGRGTRAFVYGGPVGEPALGGPTFMHRPSGMEIPEAPISHHWFDSTHISWGVLTAGINSDNWQVEGSAFNGHEPDENRYAPDSVSLNSASARVTYNPTSNLSVNASYGYLNSPESTEPGVDQHRLTAAATWSRPLGSDNLSMSAAFGRNYLRGGHSDAYLAEATLLKGPASLFARWESASKDELSGVPAGSYRIDKLLLGGVRNVFERDGFEMGLGAYLGVYHFPAALEPFYGKNPLTVGVFLRIRPARMQHDMTSMHNL